MREHHVLYFAVFMTLAFITTLSAVYFDSWTLLWAGPALGVVGFFIFLVGEIIQNRRLSKPLPKVLLGADLKDY